MATASIVRKFGTVCRNFIGDSGGNLTMILALAAVPFTLAVGAAIDYARIAREQANLSAAVDSALLAVISSDRASLTGLSDSQKAARIAELETMAEGYLAKNYNSDGLSGDDINANIVITGSNVTMTATHTLPTSLMSLAGIESTTLTITSEAKKAARPIELALVMDTTGSMGSTYMAQARTAAQSLLTRIYGGDKTAKPESANIRVSLVPFAAAVRLNKNAYDFNLSWIDTAGASSVSRLNFSNPSWHNYYAWSQLSSQPWNGCVEARPRGTAPLDYNTNDVAPTSGNTLFPAYFAPDEPTFSGSTSSPYNFDNSYISNSGTPNEQTGLASTSTSSSNHGNRQKNVNKYVNKTISSEASTDKGPWYNCAASSIVPMTYKRANIEAGIAAMTASGNTVIPEGLAWGWRTLSPTEPFTKVEAGPTQPAATLSPYGSPTWQKNLVLMTDGENNVLDNGNQVNTLNGTFYSAYGYGKAALANNRFGTTTATDSDAALDTAMLQLCTNIKNSGITIYTVAFRVSSTTILNNLKNCATSPAHYSYAADGAALTAVFNHIGDSVTNTAIHLSK